MCVVCSFYKHLFQIHHLFWQEGRADDLQILTSGIGPDNYLVIRQSLARPASSQITRNEDFRQGEEHLGTDIRTIATGFWLVTDSFLEVVNIQTVTETFPTREKEVRELPVSSAACPVAVAPTQGVGNVASLVVDGGLAMTEEAPLLGTIFVGTGTETGILTSGRTGTNIGGRTGANIVGTNRDQYIGTDKGQIFLRETGTAI